MMVLEIDVSKTLLHIRDSNKSIPGELIMAVSYDRICFEKDYIQYLKLNGTVLIYECN